MSTSTCGGNCQGPCQQAICYKCNGTACVNDNVLGTYSAVNCNGACAPIGLCGASICYKCSGAFCVRDDAGGTYQTSLCNSQCTVGGGGGASQDAVVSAGDTNNLKTQIDQLHNTRPCVTFPYPWLQIPITGVVPGTRVYAVQILELRSAVDRAYRDVTGSNYAWPTVASEMASGKVIKAVHYTEIQTAINNLPPCGGGATCNNGVVEAPEACDDGLAANGPCPATCSAVCTTNVCGGSICSQGGCQVGENCSNCPVDCPSNTCGNNCCEVGEDAVTCPADCGASTCGNNILDPGETCDPPQAGVCDADCHRHYACSAGSCVFTVSGVFMDDNTCANTCALCGNNILDPGETCDPPNPGVCDIDCHRHYACSAEICVFTAGGLYTDDSSCGGTCGPTCSDGIQNQGEASIDCGGPCPGRNDGPPCRYDNFCPGFTPPPITGCGSDCCSECCNGTHTQHLAGCALGGGYDMEFCGP